MYSSFVEFLKSSSFGSKLCEDCYPHQFSPLIDDDWKYKNFGKELFKGDFINLGVGQGYMLTTPLHLSLISGILAKKGKYELPYLVAKKQNQLSINEEITEQDWNKLQASLIDVIYSPNGTGYRINAGALKLAGKSGTAQVVDIYSREEYRKKSITSEGVDGLICGFGPDSYILGIEAISKLIYK